MATEPYVLLKGKPDGIDILLDGEIDFDTLTAHLRRKVADARRFFDGANTNVCFRGRNLSDEEERGLLDIIFAETTLDVSFVEASVSDAPVKEPDEPDAAPSPAEPKPAPLFKELATVYYQNGLRSGQSIKYDGSVVVMGDANPGSEIIAGGNVIVMGALKGMVHAGAGGDETCFISALSLNPTQLRIANIITYIPKTADVSKKQQAAKPPAKPSHAYIQNGQVYIAPLMD